MIKTMAFKIVDMDDYSIASALLTVGFLQRPFNSVEGHYVVMNEPMINHSVQPQHGRSVTFQNALYDEIKFWDRFELLDPEDDPATDIFDVRPICSPSPQ